MIDSSDVWTAAQERALQLYLAGASISELADALKVAPDEVRVWMCTESFRRALAAARLDQQELELRRLERLRVLALDTIEEGLRSQDDVQRLGAAKAVLDWPSRVGLSAQAARGLLWMASAATAISVLSVAMIGWLASEILTSRHAAGTPVRAHQHQARADSAKAAGPAVRANGATTASSPARSIPGPEVVPYNALATQPVAPLAAPALLGPSKPLRPSRPASSDPFKVRRSAHARGPLEVAEPSSIASDPVASSARPGFDGKGPGRLGISMTEREF